MDSRDLMDHRFLKWAVASRPSPGEDSSGDLSVVEPIDDGVLIGVIDGLGHGLEAAKAAEKAGATVRSCAGDPLEAIISSCHEALKGTRGAVMTLAQIDRGAQTLTWTGVGNIEGRVWPAIPAPTIFRESPPLRGGVVGHALPKITSTVLPLTRGDLVILSTDGISSDFHDEFRLEGNVQQIADDILEEYWTAKDDALVLVLRYLGGG